MIPHSFSLPPLEELALDRNFTPLHAVRIRIQAPLCRYVRFAIRDQSTRIARIKARTRRTRLIQRVEPHTVLLGPGPLHGKPEPERSQRPKRPAHGRRDKRAERAPIVPVQALFQQEQIARQSSVAVIIDQAEQEDGKDATEAADDDFEAAPRVAALAQTDDEHGDAARAD